MRLPFSIIPAVACFLALSSCQRSNTNDLLTPRINSECSVSFRRGDALGSAAPLPVSPTSDGINGADLNMNGKLIAVGAQGIFLRDEKTSRDHWIPYEAILRVSFPIQKE